jgi:cytochrome bd-type quinol oxidase subunit 2
MENTDLLLLARAQFGLNIGFHILFPTLTIALAMTSPVAPLFFAFRIMLGMGMLMLAYSLFPYVVIDQLTFWDAAAHPSSLKMVLIGALLVLPFIIAYTAFSYYVFRGKARPGVYD